MNEAKIFIIMSGLCLLIVNPSLSSDDGGGSESGPFTIVLGVAQDGGVPQAGTVEHGGWEDPDSARNVVSLGVIDPLSRQRWMIDATPDFRAQLHILDAVSPVDEVPGLDGIFLTHAHIGHYTGLMFLGLESLGADRVPVYAMPRMGLFLAKNGPWDQLVRYRNIVLKPLADGKAIQMNDRIQLTPFRVPHRQEYSEVVGFIIAGPGKSILFIPDIDKWEIWEEEGTKIEEMIAKVDVAYLDGTFFANRELGRDMSRFPHPFIADSMERFDGLPAGERAKIRFIHLNHSNPALWKNSFQREVILNRGFRVAEEWERVDL